MVYQQINAHPIYWSYLSNDFVGDFGAIVTKVIIIKKRNCAIFVILRINNSLMKMQ